MATILKPPISIALTLCAALLVLQVQLTATSGWESFGPVTEDVAFKATYLLQIFVGLQPDSMSEVHEQYQSNLASASIWQTRQEDKGEGKGIESTARRFLYNGNSRVDLEIVNGDGSGSDADDENGASAGLCRYEDGSSGSYLPSQQQQTAGQSVGGDGLLVKVLPKRSSLDSILFASSDSQTLDLDLFMADWCQEEVNHRLHHVRGLSRLLHLIECRRKEIVLDVARSSPGDQASNDDYSRGTPKRVYSGTISAYTTNSSSAAAHADDVVKTLTITVSIEHRPSKQHQSSIVDANHQLPTRSIPLSLSISYEPKVTIIVNVYQFEVTDSGAHLSESTADGHSTFLLPLGRGLSDRLAASLDDLTGPLIGRTRQSMRQFSFRASLVQTPPSALKDPIELLVVYDGQTGMLANQLSLVDRQESMGDSYRRHMTRTIYDANSWLKYHIMHNNDGYSHNLDDAGDETDSASWRSCVSDSLTHEEAQRLETGDSSMFDLQDAVFMGMALVRGIPCYVYERRIYRMPLWMGLGDNEFGWLEEDEGGRKSELYATLYESASELAGGVYEAQQIAKNRAERSSKLVRLVINIVSPTAPDSEGRHNVTIRMSYKLELHSFDWTPGIRLFEDEAHLFDSIGQECLFMAPNARHVDLELGLKPESPDRDSIRPTLRLINDAELRDELISQALTKTVGIARSQQTGLTSKYPNILHLEASLSVYELPRDRISAVFHGFAKDLAVGSASDGWSVGATSVSLEECKWRAVHTLAHFIRPTESEFNRNQVDGLKMFMYCPRTMHCVLGDDRWLPLKRPRQGFTVNSVLQFPAADQQGSASGTRSSRGDGGNRNPCVVFYVMRQSDSAYGIQERGRMSLERLAIQRDNLLDTLVNLELPAEVDGAISSETTSIEMRLTKLRVSNIIEGGADSLASNILRGLSYEPPTTAGATASAAAASYKPLVVSSLAQCDHACLMQHQCASYSFCHHHPKLECTLTTVNWTEPSKVREVGKLLLPGSTLAQSPAPPAPGTTKKRTRAVVAVQVEADGGQEVHQVKLRLSNLCSLHLRQHLHVFRNKANIMSKTPSTKQLLHAETPEQCSELCLSRASILSRLSEASGEEALSPTTTARPRQLVSGLLTSEQLAESSEREHTCFSFNFSPKQQWCELLPARDYDQLRQPTADNGSLSASRQPFVRWLAARDQMKARSDRLLRFSETTNTFELDYEQLFGSHPNQRLVLSNIDSKHLNDDNDDNRADDDGRWQMTLNGVDVHGCARMCLRRRHCRSFDTYSPAYRKQDYLDFRRESCVLNGLSWADIDAAEQQVAYSEDEKRQSTVPLVRVRLQAAAASGGDNEIDKWWHYEPSELALYLMNEPASSASFVRAALASAKVGGGSNGRGVILPPAGCGATLVEGIFISSSDSRGGAKPPIAIDHDNAEMPDGGGANVKRWWLIGGGSLALLIGLVAFAFGGSGSYLAAAVSSSSTLPAATAAAASRIRAQAGNLLRVTWAPIASRSSGLLARLVAYRQG